MNQPVFTQEQLEVVLKSQTAPKVQPEDLEAVIVDEQYYQWPGSLLITCKLTLKNGYSVTGESACADPANFNETVGRTIARKGAKEKLWGLLGYELKSKLHLIEQAGVPTGLVCGPSTKTYVGTKVVHATPVSRAEYNVIRGWQLPVDECGEDEGYLVQYTDGGVSNVPGYTGYVSWSPRDVFEKAYVTGVTPKETTHVERMVKELAELTDRIDKLHRFILTQRFTDLPEKKRTALRAQHTAMVDYQWHLTQRLKDE